MLTGILLFPFFQCRSYSMVHEQYCERKAAWQRFLFIMKSLNPCFSTKEMNHTTVSEVTAQKIGDRCRISKRAELFPPAQFHRVSIVYEAEDRLISTECAVQQSRATRQAPLPANPTTSGIKKTINWLWNLKNSSTPKPINSSFNFESEWVRR